MELRLLYSALICLILIACGEHISQPTAPASSAWSGNGAVQRTDYPLPPEDGKPSITPILPLSSTSLPLPTTTSAFPIVDIDPNTVHPIAATLPGTVTFARDPDSWKQGGLFHLRSGIIEQVLTGDIGYQVSPDGHQVIVLTDYHSPSQGDTGDTYQWYNLQTGEHETVEVTLLSQSRNLIPAPDGVHITANYQCFDEKLQVFLGTLSGFREAMQTDPALHDRCDQDVEYALTWLPDSSGVILFQMNSAGDRLIERDLEGQDKVLHELPAGQYIISLRISADGRWVVFKPSTGPTNPIALQILDRETGTVEVIAIPGYILRQGIISPDGRYLLFSENPSVDNGQCLYLTDLQALEQEPVCLMRGYQVFAWAPDP